MMAREPHVYVQDMTEPGCYYCGRPIAEHRHAYQPSNLDEAGSICTECMRRFTATPEHFDGAEPVR